MALEFALHIKGMPDTEERDFVIPLLLDGSECQEQAVARFMDALIVFKHALMTMDKRRRFGVNSRIDGRPQPDDDPEKSAALDKFIAGMEPTHALV